MCFLEYVDLLFTPSQIVEKAIELKEGVKDDPDLCNIDEATLLMAHYSDKLDALSKKFFITVGGNSKNEIGSILYFIGKIWLKGFGLNDLISPDIESCSQAKILKRLQTNIKVSTKKNTSIVLKKNFSNGTPHQVVITYNENKTMSLTNTLMICNSHYESRLNRRSRLCG